jgi:thymidylate synthase ThyX
MDGTDRAATTMTTCRFGLDFPASKDEVLSHLQEKGANDSLIEHVNSLSGNRFDEPRDIFKGIMPHPH